MTAIVINYGDRYYPAELIGITGMALLPARQYWLSAKTARKRSRRIPLDGGEETFGHSPNSFKSPKQARRYARRKWGAGNLDMGKWKPKLQRGQRRLEGGHLVTVLKVES